MTLRLASDNESPRPWDPAYYAPHPETVQFEQAQADENGRFVVFMAAAFTAGCFFCIATQIIIHMAENWL